ncbi:rRNA biogenesis protein rrp36 [Gossypium australe]|uniref:rRNA biogenesis protein rrp36 n=1 Tax=Gossypium australe TaxID=47621 RepID=A0A5B6XCA0_9ROSI|nr:rRNA biogenesis protein rrp36 [Gossypium australe]
MAYRRRQQQQQQGILTSSSSSSADVDADDLVDVEVDAAKAIRASSAHKDSSFSSAYGYGPLHSSSASPLSAPKVSLFSPLSTSLYMLIAIIFLGLKTLTSFDCLSLQDSRSHQYESMKSLNESKQGFWGSLARKAKSFLDDDNNNNNNSNSNNNNNNNNVQYQFESDGPPKSKLPQSQRPTPEMYHNTYQSDDRHHKTSNPTLQKGIGAITSSLNYIGNAVEEGLTIVENRTAGIIQETRKHIKKKSSGSVAQNEYAKQPQMQQQVRTPVQADQEIQLKASRDVAMAMAAKAKLLLRELKTVRADLAFAKERCAQLEEENRVLRENRDRGDNPENDELIRLQLETLLAEKARLAHENSIYARENRFLREVVEYHQLTMQDVVYLDDRTEEVTEVYPIKVPSLPNINSMPATSGALPSEASLDTSLKITPNITVCPVPPPEFAEGS